MAKHDPDNPGAKPFVIGSPEVSTRHAAPDGEPGRLATGAPILELQSGPQPIVEHGIDGWMQ